MIFAFETALTMDEIGYFCSGLNIIPRYLDDIGAICINIDLYLVNTSEDLELAKDKGSQLSWTYSLYLDLALTVETKQMSVYART